MTMLSAIIGVYGAFQRPWGPVTLLSAIIGVFDNVIGVYNIVDCETSVGQFLAGVFSQEGDQFSRLHHSFWTELALPLCRTAGAQLTVLGSSSSWMALLPSFHPVSSS